MPLKWYSLAGLIVLSMPLLLAYGGGIDDILGDYGKASPSPKASPTAAGGGSEEHPPHETVKLNLFLGWNLISSPLSGGNEIICSSRKAGGLRECENRGSGRNELVPMSGNLTGGKITDTSCNPADIWHLNEDTKQYVKVGKLQEETLLKPGDGYWVLITNKTCDLHIRGNLKVSLSGKRLKTGLNQVGSPFFDTNIKDIRGDCTVSSGPFTYRYRTKKGEYVKTEVMHSGEGYFVTVVSDCTLSDKK